MARAGAWDQARLEETGSSLCPERAQGWGSGFGHPQFFFPPPPPSPPSFPASWSHILTMDGMSSQWHQDPQSCIPAGPPRDAGMQECRDGAGMQQRGRWDPISSISSLPPHPLKATHLRDPAGGGQEGNFGVESPLLALSAPRTPRHHGQARDRFLTYFSLSFAAKKFIFHGR